MKAEIDDGFIGRVYVSSAYLWAFVALAVFALWGIVAAAGWTVGCALSVGILRSLEWVIKRNFVPGADKAKREFAKFSLLKLAGIVIILIGVVLVGGRSFAFVGAFCAGLLLAQAVIVAKVLGMLVAERLGS